MDADRFRQVMALFDQACEQDPAGRAAFLASCTSDEDLRAEVERLLNADAGPTRTVHGLDGGAAQIADDMIQKSRRSSVQLDAPMPVLAGNYRILRVIGEGGMGIVFEAEQANPQRRVALKAIRPGFSSQQILKRFELEANILGRLQHPGIAQIYEAGIAQVDRPEQAYFAMEMVNGLPLTDYVTKHAMSVEQRLELHIKICEAVQHAHQRGVIHRDLKPANILVCDETTEQPASRNSSNNESKKKSSGDSTPFVASSLSRSVASPKILDFGVARLIQNDLQNATMQTDSGQLIGTLPYMSPEQVAGNQSAVDTRSDVYALGVLLFRTLTGELPRDLRTKSLPDAVRAIRDEPPRRAGDLNRSLRGDVETIIAKALESDRSRRYQSAAELAADIRRHLEGEPIDARRASAMYVMRKAIMRHRVVAAFAAILLALLATFSIVSFAQSKRFQKLAASEHRLRIGREAALHEVEQQRSRANAELAVSNIERGRLLGRTGNLAFAESLIWREHIRHPESRHSYWALWDVYACQPCVATLNAHTNKIWAVAFRPDSRQLASGGGDGKIKLWDADSWRCTREIDAHDGQVQGLAFSRDGTRLASTGDDGRVVVWKFDSGEILRTLDGFRRISSTVCFGVDRNQLIASAHGEKTIRIWDVDSGRLLREIADPQPIARVCLSPDGATIACTGGGIRLWKVDGDDTEPIMKLTPPKPVSVLAFAPDGLTLFAGGARVIYPVDTIDLKLLEQMSASGGNIRGLAISKDGRTMAAGSWWSIKIWDVVSRKLRHDFSIQEAVLGFDLSPDGRFIAVGTETGPLRIWETEPARAATFLSDHVSPVVVACNPVGGAIATGDWTGRIRHWKPGAGISRDEFEVPQVSVRAIHFNSDGSMLATSGSDGIVRIWNSADSSLRRSFAEHHPSTTNAMAWHPAGKTLALNCADNSTGVFDVSTGNRILSIPAPAEILSAAFDRNGETLATVARDGLVHLWSATGRPIGSLKTNAQPWTVAFHSDGRMLATGTWGNSIELWDYRKLERIALLEGHSGTVWAVAFHPSDSALLASAGADGTVRLWDVIEHRCLLTLDELRDAEVISIAFSPDGDRLIAGGSSDRAVAWDLTWYRRHILGNTQYQMSHNRDTASEPITAPAPPNPQ